MIGIVIAAHGPLPDALLESARMIVGDPEQVTTVSLMPGDSLEGLVDRLRAAADEVASDDGVLILLDLFGGTPSNAATLITQQSEHIHAVSGVNVPMLLETLLTRLSGPDLVALTNTAKTSGTSGIVNIAEAFKEFQARKKESE